MASQRERAALWAAALCTGPAELLEFLLPLWAGIALNASAAQVGVLVALETGVSLVGRPLAGVLADARERRTVAAAGALLYGLSCLGYAAAESFAAACAAAAVGGAGAALLWVALRAMVGERLAEDSAVYPRLLSASETGTWVAFVAGLTLLGAIDFTGLFLGCAAACALGAGYLLASPPRASSDRRHAVAEGGLAPLRRRLRPMLLAVVITMTAEAAVGILLLLHLQRGFDLGIVEIAYVFLPGAIAMSVLPGPLHRLVLRFGRTRVLAGASVASAMFAVSLAWAPSPLAIAALWVLTGVAWAAVIPIEQAVVAEVSGDRLGSGIGLYESAALAGASVGALAAGVLYGASSWELTCILAAAVILSGAVIVPRAVRALGVADFPVERPAPTPAAAPAPPTAPAKTKPRREPRPTAERLRDLAGHTLLFVAAQIALAVAGLSWTLDLLTGDAAVLDGGGNRDGIEGLLRSIGRVWTFILIADVLWTLGTVAWRRARTRRR